MLRIDPVFEDDFIPILLASDDKYAKYITVVIESIIRNSSNENNYDIIVLGSNISKASQTKLLSSIKNKSNFSVRIFDLTNELKKTDFNIVSYYSNAIYMRIYMPTVMQAYKKAIYLDCDLILERDIADLYHIDIGKNLIGAVRDIGMLMHYFTEDKIYISDDYFKTVLSDIDPEDYFNSGVLVMNLERFRSEFSLGELITAVNKPNLLFPDQDGLNILCSGKTYFLDPAWNTLPETYGNRRISEMRKYIPEKYMEGYIRARTDPFIVHYAMKQKPWNHTVSIDPDLFLRFWKYARSSACFSEIFFGMENVDISEKLLFLGRSIDDLRILYQKDDVLYSADDLIIAKHSSMPAKLDFYKIYGNTVTIEGSVPLATENEFKTASLWFFDGYRKHFAKLYRRNVAKRTKEEVLAGFRVTIPIGSNITSLSLWSRIGHTAIRKGLNFSQHFPINRLIRHQYYASDVFILSYDRGSLIIRRYNKKLAFECERLYAKELKRSKLASSKAVTVRYLAKYIKEKKKKPIWLIKDNFLNSDNGVAFYNYSKGREEARVYLVVHKNDKGIEKLRELGADIVFEGSRKFKWLSLISDWIISSVISPSLFNPFGDRFDIYRDILASRKFLFLQHGVISQDLSREHNKFMYHPTGFLVSGEAEYNSLLKYDYHYEPRDIWLTGLPRFDLLTNEDSKLITVSFTWRKSLNLSIEATDASKRSLLNSSYFKFLHALINSDDLRYEARKRGYRIGFKPHPLMTEYGSMFIDDDNSDALLLNGISFSETFSQSSLVITDYSSAIYDALYLGKPIIYCQYDKDDFFSGDHAYDKGYLDYEADGFGEVEYTLDGAIGRIIEYIDNGCALKPLYKERIDRFFKYRDRKNSERVYERILEYGKGSTK